jgi:GntR family transcriptional repressor for pyruvate dehydrogenase complex
MVRMRSGEGTYVADNPTKFLDRVCAHSLLTTEKDLRDLAETRLILETESAALCAQRAAPEELAALERSVEEMGQAIRQGDFTRVDLDLQFHFTIAESCKNPVLAKLLHAIRGLLQDSIRMNAQLPGAATLAQHQHTKILDALKQHQPLKARRAMKTHITTFLRSAALRLRANRQEEESKAVAAAG